MTQQEIQQLPSIVSHNIRFYYEEDKNTGAKVLRHILVGSPKNILEVPTDGGITIDTVPPDSVGTEEIKNDSVQMEDLNSDVKKKMTHIYDEEGEGIILGGLAKEKEE